jgi:hypothetical protein
LAELVGKGHDILRPELLERFAHPPVQAPSAGRRQFLEQRGPDQLVGEPVAVRAGLLDQSCLHRLIQGIQQALLWTSTQLSE